VKLEKQAQPLRRLRWVGFYTPVSVFGRAPTSKTKTFLKTFLNLLEVSGEIYKMGYIFRESVIKGA
jgi:hypothetical protein